MDANVFGVVRVTQVFLPCMVAAGTGTSSTSSAGKWASMYQSPYNASKHALIGLTRCVALEIAKTGVVVTAVCPGFVDTPLLLESDLLRRLGHEAPRPPGDGGVARSDRPAHRSREVAELVLYLSGPHAGAVTGQSYSISGGLLFI